MANGLSTEVNVRRKVKDGWFVYTCDQLPGLYVAHMDDKVAYNDLPNAIATLLRLDLGVDFQVTHKLSYADFLRRVGLEESAVDAVFSRTEELIAEDEYFPFIVQPISDRHRRT